MLKNIKNIKGHLAKDVDWDLVLVLVDFEVRKEGRGEKVVLFAAYRLQMEVSEKIDLLKSLKGIKMFSNYWHPHLIKKF